MFRFGLKKPGLKPLSLVDGIPRLEGRCSLPKHISINARLSQVPKHAGIRAASAAEIEQGSSASGFSRRDDGISAAQAAHVAVALFVSRRLKPLAFNTDADARRLKPRFFEGNTMVASQATWFLTAGVLSLTILVSGCKKKEVAEKDLPQINIETMTVQTGTVSDTLTVPAHIEADPTKLVHIFPPLSGRIVSLRVVTGQEVHRGQAIATLQSGDVAAVRSDFEKAKTQAEHDDRARDRGKVLYDHEVLSLASYQDLQSAAAASRSELERARQRIRELGFSESGTSDNAPIASPISGTVIEIGAANGELQRSLDNSSAGGIATVANLDSVWVVGDVFERDIALLKARESVDVTVQAFPGETFHGSIANIGDTFDATTHTLRARVVLQNPGHRLKPAMFASLQIQRPPVGTIIVPQTAVVHDGDNTGVYLATSGGKYELHPVNIGATRGGNIEIKSGLHDGDRIVKKGAAFLRAPVGD